MRQVTINRMGILPGNFRTGPFSTSERILRAFSIISVGLEIAIVFSPAFIPGALAKTFRKNRYGAARNPPFPPASPNNKKASPV